MYVASGYKMFGNNSSGVVPRHLQIDDNITSN